MVTAFSCSSRSVKIQYDEYTASRISSDDVQARRIACLLALGLGFFLKYWNTG